MGVVKTKRVSLFSIPGSSWFIYTPTKKINILKLKTPNQNIQKSQQNPHFCQSTLKITISHLISSNPIKINTFNHLTTKNLITIYSISSYINIKIPRKFNTISDQQFSQKNTTNKTSYDALFYLKNVNIHSNHSNSPINVFYFLVNNSSTH